MTQATHPPVPPGPAGFDATLVQAVLADACRPGVHVYGISGLQGSGKSTLALQLARAAADAGRRVAVLSLDDFYLDLPQRQALARRVHPLLATRGPPGTHDLPLALATLAALRAGRPVPVPRFDKLADRRLPVAAWDRVAGADLVVFEGWFTGTPAEPPEALLQPVNSLERDEDRDGTWRRHCNHALARDYPPLWACIDRLLLLEAPGFEVVPDWRWQQECTARLREPARASMTRARCDRFVQHFERISRHALRTIPAVADLVIPLDATRRPGPHR